MREKMSKRLGGIKRLQIQNHFMAFICYVCPMFPFIKKEKYKKIRTHMWSIIEQITSIFFGDLLVLCGASCDPCWLFVRCAARPCRTLTCLPVELYLSRVTRYYLRFDWLLLHTVLIYFRICCCFSGASLFLCGQNAVVVGRSRRTSLVLGDPFL